MTPTPKDAITDLLDYLSPRLTGWQKKREEEQARLAHLRAVQATWPPLSEAHEQQMEQCRRRLAVGGAARAVAARMIAEARARMPRRESEE